ncbi:unnamed protein product [Spirodela intermedia]|uniref:Uncharacterized protein n=1 Tax=Spirodela intermedia TaxID=51605 RepID=A0A7I8JEC2_SPIIN|nr:unnamed protein product [Spirodela intermedia]CAA6668115.1 unnamed protein product [Spirodela intermedia]
MERHHPRARPHRRRLPSGALALLRHAPRRRRPRWLHLPARPPRLLPPPLPTLRPPRRLRRPRPRRQARLVSPATPTPPTPSSPSTAATASLPGPPRLLRDPPAPPRSRLLDRPRRCRLLRRPPRRGPTRLPAYAGRWSGPDEAALVGAARAAGGLCSPELATWVYCYACRRRGLRVTAALGSALVVALANSGRISIARQMFDEMPIKERNLLTRTSLVCALAAHGKGKEALAMFEGMASDGLKPDHVAFIGALTACSHAGLLEEGTRLFGSMERDHGLEPMMEHYGCMVDLMGRAGMVREAHEFVQRMPIRPGPVIWRTLLGACVAHGYVDLAEHVRGEIAEMDPDHDGDYVLLSNAYGGIGRWTEKAGLRAEMGHRGVPKSPGLSVPSQ